MKKETKNFLLSISFFALMQPLLYYIVKFLQHNYYIIGTSIDNIIPFIPYFIYSYNLFYPFIILTYYYFYKKDSENYYIGIKAGIISTLIAYIIFIIYPTITIRPDINTFNIDPITKFVINTTYSVDSPAINCFPSIHCIFCFIIIYLTILSSKIPLKNKIIIFSISFLIIISTLLVKQHYILDVIGAFILSIIITFIIKKE